MALLLLLLFINWGVFLDLIISVSEVMRPNMVMYDIRMEYKQTFYLYK